MIDKRTDIHPSAQIGNNVKVGPWTVIGADVEIGDDCDIKSHVVIRGPTTIGRGNSIFQFATIGDASPALNYQGEKTWLHIGDHNTLREGVTIHRGTAQDQSVTRIGNHNLLMAYVHVAHDCIIHDHCIFSNNAALSGHVVVGNHANLGGYSGVAQYRRIGAHTMIGGSSTVLKDVPDFMLVYGDPATVRGLNVIGLKRRAFSKDALRLLKQAYKIVYRTSLTTEQALEQLAELADPEGHVAALVQSIRCSKYGIIRPSGGARDAADLADETGGD